MVEIAVEVVEDAVEILKTTTKIVLSQRRVEEEETSKPGVPEMIMIVKETERGVDVEVGLRTMEKEEIEIQIMKE